MKNLSPRTLSILALAFAATSVLFLAGCNNVGDENPVSPDQMQNIRQQQSKERENFKPDTTRPPGPQ